MRIGDIEFGEIDAKNEVFKQRRSGKSIFRTSFQTPPNIDLDTLLRGENFFIYGQKGCGKTALLLYLQEISAEKHWSTETVFFRSGISEQERQQILSGTGFSVITVEKRDPPGYDFLFNWLWVIYSSVLRRIEPDWVFDGQDVLKDLKNLLRVNDETHVRAFNDLTANKIAAKAKLALNIPFVTAELSADIDAVRQSPKERLSLEIIQICERYINKVKILPKYRVLLFFDELELFWNKRDQRTRDLCLIRDLLQAVSRTNQSLDKLGSSVVIYASVRSEVLEEVNQLSPEFARDVEDFGVEVNWNVKADASEQPILNIVEAKIRASEIEHLGDQTDDIWNTYFPEKVYGRDAEGYLLDISMFKPRLIVSRLNLARDYSRDSDLFSSEAFEETNTKFSANVWREVSEQLLQTYTAKQVDNLKEILTGWKATFVLSEVEKRVNDLNYSRPGAIDGFRSLKDIESVFGALYEAGAVGNRFRVSDAGNSAIRDRWAFRGYSDPIYDKPFVLHESLRKYFQLIHE